MKLNKLIYIILGSLALSSCADQMNYREYNNYDEDYVKLNFDNVGGLITTIYLGLDTDFGNYSGALLGSASDESEYAYSSNEVADFYNGAWSPTNAKSSMWTSCYEGIANCNLFLDKYTGLTFPELELNEDYAAEMCRYNNYQYEVRFLRAYFYFNLVRQYGDVPFTDHVLSAAESNTLTRRPAQEIFDYIVSECKAIQEDIVEDYSKVAVPHPTDPAETGRANKRAVLALKARAALYAASPLFNPTNDKDLWYRAVKANKELLDECIACGMALKDSYSSLWSVDNYKDTKEIILGRRANKETSTMESYNFPAGLTGSKGGNCPTQTLVDAYEMTDGKPYNKSEVYSANDPYTNRDPRFKMTIAHNGMTGWPSWNDEALETFQSGMNGEPNTGGTPTGYYLKKYCQEDIDLRDNSVKKSAYHTWITYRLGEFYLNYAEALFKYLELNGSSKAGDQTIDEFTMTPNEAVNKTRRRKGVEMPVFPSDLTNEEWWTKYQNERMVELAFEGHRFWDVRRWKEADKHFKSIDEMKITKSGSDLTYTRKTVDRKWDDKMYFFPIPRTEMMKNTSLEQNPGW